jgi:hypothetical protein
LTAFKLRAIGIISVFIFFNYHIDFIGHLLLILSPVWEGVEPLNECRNHRSI